MLWREANRTGPRPGRACALLAAACLAVAGAARAQPSDPLADEPLDAGGRGIKPPAWLQKELDRLGGPPADRAPVAPAAPPAPEPPPPPLPTHRQRVEADWFRQDGLTADAPDCRAAAVKVLDLARRTLEAVAGRLAEAERAALPAAELDALAKAQAEAGPDADWRGLYLRSRRLRRRIALADPLLAFDRLLVNERPPPLYSHMCDQYLGRHSRPGEGLLVLENWRDEPRPRPVVGDGLPPGSTHHPDLSYDGTRVLFAFCDHTEPERAKRRFHIWEAALDGSLLVQRTGGPDDPMETMGGRDTVLVEDWDPCYLPGGGFAFISTRNQGYGRCHGGRYTPSYILYRAEADGSGIRPISFGEANEWDPAVLHDGTLVYTRWDYINRHDTLFQSLWTTRPDGTATAHFYGNYTRNPCMTAEARPIPGSPNVVCTAMAHHSYTAGSIIVVDNRAGLDGPEPIRRVTPDASFPETEGWPRGSYATPWPLSEEVFLVAYSPDPLVRQGRVQRENAYGIYLADTLGGRELLYRDPTASAFSPIPVRRRPEPAAWPSTVEPERETGTFYVEDVYEGLPPEVKRGVVKRLRIVDIYQQPKARVPPRSVARNEIVKGIVGTVPVEADGSVAFTAPAGRPLLFQLLDADGLAVMAMRSQVYLQGGERAGCVGCHEPRTRAASPHREFLTMRVRKPDPPPGPAYEGGFSFVRTVQPVLDRHCLRCHGGEKPAAGLSLDGTPEKHFTKAYVNLVRRKGMVAVAQRNQEADASRPGLYGARGGRLARFLLTTHRKNAKLSAEAFECIAGWLDLNAQFRGDYGYRPPPPAAEMARGDAAKSAAACGGGAGLSP